MNRGALETSPTNTPDTEADGVPCAGCSVQSNSEGTRDAEIESFASRARVPQHRPKCGQLVRRFAVLRDFGPAPPTLRAMTAFCAVFVTARFAAGFAAFALPAASVAVLDLTVFDSFAGAAFVAVFFFVTRDAGRVSTVGEVSS